MSSPARTTATGCSKPARPESASGQTAPILALAVLFAFLFGGDAILGALQAGGERMWPRMTKYDWAGRGADQLSPQTYREWSD